MRKFVTIIGALPLTLGAVACADFSPPETVPAPVAELPASYGGDEEAAERQSLNWWHDFNDPVLNRLVEQALIANLDIAEAAARVEEARAQSRIAGADRLPTLNASAGGNYSDSPLAGTNFGAIGGGAAPTRLTNESYTTGLNFAYELDFWGRALNDARARGPISMPPRRISDRRGWAPCPRPSRPISKSSTSAHRSP